MMDIKEEKELMRSIEAGEWKPITGFENIKQELANAAKKTAIKDYRINIRISKRDVEALKTSRRKTNV